MLPPPHSAQKHLNLNFKRSRNQVDFCIKNNIISGFIWGLRSIGVKMEIKIEFQRINGSFLNYKQQHFARY